MSECENTCKNCSGRILGICPGVIGTVVVALLILACIYAPIHFAIKKSSVKKASANRLEQIKQEVIDIDLPLPLTKKEQDLMALKTELLGLIGETEKANALLKKNKDLVKRDRDLLKKQFPTKKRKSGRYRKCEDCGFKHVKIEEEVASQDYQKKKNGTTTLSVDGIIGSKDVIIITRCDPEDIIDTTVDPSTTIEFELISYKEL